MRERRIANRESRPSRILGCTWGEWGSMALPTLLLLFSSPPFLFGFVMVVLIVATVLAIHRRFPPGSIEDWADMQLQILLKGHQRAGPTASDTALRDGALSPLDEAP